MSNLKVLKHPDREKIIKDLTDGVSVRKVAAYLKEKYNNKKKLQLSIPTLQSFRKEYLKLDGKVLKDIQEASIACNRRTDEDQRIKELESTNAYQDKINSIAETHLDVAGKILRLDGVIESRLEYWFNAIKSGEASPSAADREMRQYMDRQILLLQQYKKFVEGVADRTIDYNVNVTVLNDQIELIKGVIKEILSELDTETSILFMDKFNRKLNNIKYSPQSPERVDTKILNAVDAEILNDMENIYG